jgi:DNA-binding CsgD family transcriptional regulator
MKRILDKTEEALIRFHHHEFGGLPVKDTAVKMGISARKVYSYLNSIKRKAPQLFPILTAEQFKIYKLLVYENYSYADIAEEMECTPARVNKIVVQLHDKGFNTDRPKIQRYDGSMDDKIVRKF